MLKKIGLLLCAAAVFTAGGVHAENVRIEDMINSVITVEGKTTSPDETLNILVLESGVSPEEAETNPGQFIVYQGEVTSDEKGNYKKSFRIPCESYKDYDVYFGDKTESVAVAPISEKTAKAKEIISSDETKIKAVLSDEYSRKVLGINTQILINSDIDEVGKKVYEKLKTEGSFDLDNEDTTIVVREIERLNRIINEYALISCYNNSKKAAIFENNEILRNDLLKLDEKSTVLECYNNVLNSTGKSYVQNNITGKNYGEIEDLRKEYAKLVLYVGISNDVNAGGTGHINTLFTKDNVGLAELNLPKYMALSESKRATVNSKLITDKTLTYDNFASKMESYAEDTLKVGGNGDGGSSTSPGRGTSASKSGISVGTGNSNSDNEQNITNPNSVFADLSEAAWAEEAIMSLNEKGIMTGVGDNKFAPQDRLTREQAVKIICEMNQLINTEDANTDFEDVDSEAWYAKYIITAVNKGIVNGVSENSFGIGMNITRQDFVTMLYRAMDNKESYDGILSFEDSSEIAEYAKDAVGSFVNKGIISGYPDNTFAPNGFITRAEAASIVYKLLK